jgi:hypothetical protein
MHPSTGRVFAGCDARRRLGEEYAIATRLYSEAVAHLTGSFGISDADFKKLRQNVSHAHQRAEQAMVAFTTHIETHKCLE